MLMTVYTLVILFGANSQGKAIDTSLKFTTLDGCEAAAASVRKQNDGWVGNAVFATCVEQE